MMTNKISLGKRNWLLIYSCWAICQIIFLFASKGIVTNDEATAYLSISDRIIAGIYDTPANFLLYSGFIAILVIIKSLGFNYEWVYMVQLFFSALALAGLTALLCRWLSSVKAILLAALLYATCPFIQQWVSYLFTESFFASLLCIGIFLLFTQDEKRTYKAGFYAVLLIIPFCRPIGFIFIAVSICYWVVTKNAKNRLFNISFALIYLVAVSLLTRYLFNNSKNFFYPDHNASANIICGYPSNLVQYIKHPYKNGMSLFEFFTSNPAMTIRLFCHRLFKAIWLTRPYFSPMHNSVIISALIPYFFLTISGLLIALNRCTATAIVLCLAILLFLAPIVLLCADWVNRFVVPVYTVMILFMGFGVNYWLEKLAVFSKKGIACQT